jgi:hypothetical protein
MHDVLHQRTAELSRLAAKIRTSLDEAESTVPSINEQLDKLAAVGMVDFQIEGPSVYCRPAGVSSAFTDDFVVYQAAIVMPGGVGAVIWDANEYHEHANRPYGEPVNLAPRFVPYAKCPTLVRALLVSHAGRMLDSLMRDVRLLGS